jgi:hypothetical protein
MKVRRTSKREFYSPHTHSAMDRCSILSWNFVCFVVKGLG